jgi:hypothetical protein
LELLNGMHVIIVHIFAQVAWNKRDLLAYAVGVGAKNDELQFVYGVLLQRVYHFTPILTMHAIF